MINVVYMIDAISMIAMIDKVDNTDAIEKIFVVNVNYSIDAIYMNVTTFRLIGFV